MKARETLGTLRDEWRIVWKYAKGYRWAMPLLVGLGFAASIAETLGISLIVLFLYAVIGDAANAAEGNGILSRLFSVGLSVSGGDRVTLGLMIFGLIVAKAALSLTYSLFTTRIKNAISERTRRDVYRRYLEMPYGELRRRDEGALLNLLTAESWSIADAFYAFTRLATNLCAILVFSIFLASIAFVILAIAVVGAGLIVLVSRYLGRPARRLGNEAIVSLRELTGQTVNTLQGMRAVRAFSAESYMKVRFEACSAKVRQVLIRLDRMHSVLGPVTDVSYFILLGVIAWSASAFAIGTPAALSAIALLYRLQPHIKQFEATRIGLAGMGTTLETVDSILTEISAIEDAEEGRPVKAMEQGITFDGVSFRYPGASTPSLSGASFTIPAGKQTAISGLSGAGKTTIVNLLLGLYRPCEGEVRIDGIAMKDIKRASWLEGVTIAGQDMELLAGSIRDNFLLARPDASEIEIASAARLAGIHDFIARLPLGYDTAIGDRGMALSGGQRQRLALARAFLRKPRILILDEATNAIDRSTEERIRRNVHEVMAGATVIHITHRPDEVVGLDHVVQLEGGRVLYSGPPPGRRMNALSAASPL